MPNFLIGSVSPASDDWKMRAASATSRFMTDAKSAARLVISSTALTTSPPSPATVLANEANCTARPLNSLRDRPAALAASSESCRMPSLAAPKVTSTALSDSLRSDAPSASFVNPANATPANAIAPAPNFVMLAPTLSSFDSALPSSFSAALPIDWNPLTAPVGSTSRMNLSRSAALAMTAPFRLRRRQRRDRRHGCRGPQRAPRS